MRSSLYIVIGRLEQAYPPSRLLYTMEKKIKKQLTLVAAICTGLANQLVFAANVQVYGRVDNGVYFTNIKVNGVSKNSFTMESGMAGAQTP